MWKSALFGWFSIKIKKRYYVYEEDYYVNIAIYILRFSTETFFSSNWDMKLFHVAKGRVFKETQK